MIEIAILAVSILGVIISVLNLRQARRENKTKALTRLSNSLKGTAVYPSRSDLYDDVDVYLRVESVVVDSGPLGEWISNLEKLRQRYAFSEPRFETSLIVSVNGDDYEDLSTFEIFLYSSIECVFKDGEVSYFKPDFQGGNPVGTVRISPRSASSFEIRMEKTTQSHVFGRSSSDPRTARRAARYLIESIAISAYKKRLAQKDTSSKHDVDWGIVLSRVREYEQHSGAVETAVEEKEQAIEYCRESMDELNFHLFR